MGNVGAVATFLDDLLKYFAMDPDGYARASVERKLETLHEASIKAVEQKDWAAVDRCVAQYRELQRATG